MPKALSFQCLCNDGQFMGSYGDFFRHRLHILSYLLGMCELCCRRGGGLFLIRSIANRFSASLCARLASLGAYWGFISLEACSPEAVKASNVLMCRSSCLRDSSGSTLGLLTLQCSQRSL